MANKCISCNNCGHVGWSKNRGNFLITIVLAFFFLVPAVIYEIWRRSGLGVCENCGSGEVVPSNQCMTEKPSDNSFLIVPIMLGFAGAFVLLLGYAVINGGPDTQKTTNDYENLCMSEGLRYYQSKGEYPTLIDGGEVSTRVLNDCKGSTTGKYVDK